MLEVVEHNFRTNAFEVNIADLMLLREAMIDFDAKHAIQHQPWVTQRSSLFVLHPCRDDERIQTAICMSPTIYSSCRSSPPTIPHSQYAGGSESDDGIEICPGDTYQPIGDRTDKHVDDDEYDVDFMENDGEYVGQ